MTDTSTADRDARRAIVIGGSFGGLFAANILRGIGWQVDVYERSRHDLDSRGGGIVLQPDVVRLFHKVGVKLESEFGVTSRDRVTYDPTGRVISRNLAPQTQTSWNLVYNEMKSHFGAGHYHKGKALVDLVQQDHKVTAVFDDGTREIADLLVGADGARSTVRARVDPGNGPRYAGYVAFRGLLEESQVPQAAQDMLGNFSFANNHHSHSLGYLVPGENNSTKEGKRLFNWVWYRVISEASELPDLARDKEGEQREYTVPPGKLAARWRDRLYQEADELLPPGFRAVVQATPEPFAQAILDLVSSRMVWDRVITLGDASFIPRPHTAAGAAKAAANSLDLGEALLGATDLTAALRRWEGPQLRLGEALYQQGTQTGNYLMFKQ